MRVWTLAWDDDQGTGCSVHLTEREANLELIERLTDEHTDERDRCMGMLDAEDEELWEYMQDNLFESLNTYNIDSQEIEPGLQVFNDRELATVLHALRILQEIRQPDKPAGGCLEAEEYGLDEGDQSSCDHYDEAKALSDEEIDALCERLNLGPEDPREDTHISEGYCPEHGLVKTVDDAGIDKCPDCGRATSFDAEEAARFEHQDDEPMDVLSVVLPEAVKGSEAWKKAEQTKEVQR